MKIKRRDFIKNATMAGALPAVIPFNIIKHTKPDSNIRRTESDSHKVNIGFIGVGHRGQNHLESCLRRKDVKVVAICDPDKEWAIPTAQKRIERYYGGDSKVVKYTEGFYDYQNLLKRDDLDAVIISTPWSWHIPQRQQQ